MRRVVITGIGPVCATGIGKDEFWGNLLSGKMHLREIPPEYETHYRFKSRFFVPKPDLPPEGLKNTMEEMSKIAVVAAKLAVEDAKLKELRPAGVILGVGMSSLRTGFESYMAHVTGAGRFSRMVIPMLMPNSAAAWVSMLLGAKGVCYTVNASCASGAAAIGEAYRHIQSGGLDLALTGAVESLDDGKGAIMRGFDMLTTLTQSEDGRPAPFSRDRSGFLFNMGAGCVLVLEALEHAERRGAEIYAEITGFASNSDCSSIVQMPENPAEIRKLFDIAKDVKIDYFNAHGTGTIQNDQIEADLLKEIFGGGGQPLINSTKSILGHCIGASSAVEAAVTAMTLKTGFVHGNIAENTIEGLNIPAETVKADVRHALSASYGFGGHNTLIMLSKVC